MKGLANRSFAFLVGLLLAIGFAPAVHADDTVSVTATSAEFRSGDVAADLSLFWIREDPELPTQSFEMKIQAGVIVGNERSQTTTQVVTPGVSNPNVDGEIPSLAVSAYTAAAETSPVHLEDATLDSYSFGNNMRLKLHARAPSSMEANLGQFNTHAGPDAIVCGRSISVDDPACSRGSNADDYVGFHYETVQGPTLISTSAGGYFHVVLEGDMHMQVMGLDFLDEEGQPLRSNSDTQDVTPAGGAREITHRMLNLELKDARIEIWGQDFAGNVDWASSSQLIQPDGLATLGGASDARDQGSASEPLILEEQENVRLTAQGGSTMAVSLQERSKASILASAIGVAPEQLVASTLLFVGAATILSFVGFGIYQVWRMQRVTMQDVELALEAKRYGAAARMASRLLRREPDSEDIAVARAVALSRAGNHARVIREVKRRLGRMSPADGVLHYILGLAHLELDQRDEAFVNLQEAARRTPSLELDVADRLGVTAPSPSGQDAYA